MIALAEFEFVEKKEGERRKGRPMLIPWLTSLSFAAGGESEYIQTPKGPIPRSVARDFCGAELSFIGSVVNSTRYIAVAPSGFKQAYYDIEFQVRISHRGTKIGKVETMTIPVKYAPHGIRGAGSSWVVALQKLDFQPANFLPGQRYVSILTSEPEKYEITDVSAAQTFAAEVCNVAW